MIFKRGRLSIRYLVMSLLVLLTSSPQAFGLGQDFYQNNDILYYQRGATCEPSPDGETATPITTETTDEYSNPVFNGVGQGPTVIRGDDGTYHVYLTSSRDHPLKHLTSRNLTTWREVSRQTISNLGDLPSGEKLAPGIAKTGDHYTIVFVGTDYIGYATSNDAGGPFEYRGKLKTTAPGEAVGRILDPDIYTEDGRIYLLYGSSPLSIAEIDMNSNGSMSVGRERTLLEKGSGSVPFTIEQPEIQKIDGWYYLFYSAGHYDRRYINTANEYSVRVARSRSLEGPFKSDNHSHYVIEGERRSGAYRAPGVSSIIQDAEGQYWMFYNAYKPPYGKDDRRLMLDKLEIQNGWPVASDGYPSTRSEAPIPGVSPGGEADVSSNGCVCRDPNASGTALRGNTNAERIYNYFIDQGLEPIHAAGITGNAAIESAGTYNPQIFGGGGNRYRGIFQWGLVDQAPEKTGEDPGNGYQLSNDDSPPTMRGDRWGKLVTWSGEQDLSPFTLDAQLGYAWHEGTTDADSYDIEDLKRTRDEKEAALHWGKYFERAITNGVLQAGPEREAAATLALQQYGDGAGGGGSTPSGSDSSGSDCGSDTQGLVSGGMSLSQAQGFMNHYKDLARTYADRRGVFTIPGENVKVYGSGCSESGLANCSTFSEYFVGKYTRGTQAFPDGKDMVGQLLATDSGFEDGGSTPKVYAVFSRQSGGGGFGHTGIVLGMDTDRGKMIIGEASCGGGIDAITAKEVDIAEFSTSDYSYAYTDNILKENSL